LRLELQPDAITEAREARQWYERRSPDAAAAFFRELDRSLATIREGPMRWPEKAGVRRLVMRRFPFTVFHRVIDS